MHAAAQLRRGYSISVGPEPLCVGFTAPKCAIA